VQRLAAQRGHAAARRAKRAALISKKEARFGSLLPVLLHNSVAFTLTRYGGLFEDSSKTAVDRLDALLGGASKPSDNVSQLNTREKQ
jgi:hypothetical protein